MPSSDNMEPYGSSSGQLLNLRMACTPSWASSLPVPQLHQPQHHRAPSLSGILGLGPTPLKEEVRHGCSIIKRRRQTVTLLPEGLFFFLKR